MFNKLAFSLTHSTTAYASSSCVGNLNNTDASGVRYALAGVQARDTIECTRT